MAGSFASVKKAFGLGALRRSRTSALAYEVAISIPRRLAGVIQQIHGLEASPHPLRRPLEPEARELPGEVERGEPTRGAPPSAATAEGARIYPPSAATAEGARIYPPPTIAAYDDLPKLRGEGQCIGIILPRGDFADEDLEAYCRRLEIAPRPTIVRVKPNKAQQIHLADYEATLDVEIAAAICPRARIVVYGTEHEGTPGLKSSSTCCSTRTPAIQQVV